MKPIKKPIFILPRLMRLTAFSLAIIGGLSYGLWQGRYLIVGPAVTVNEPPSIVQNDRTVTVSGTAKNATSLYLNGRPIVTDQSGTFTEAVVLENGHTVVSIDAKDRYGRSTHWEQPFVYVEETGLAGRSKEEESRMGL